MKDRLNISKPVKESIIVNQCIKWLWANGCYCWRQNSGAYKPTGTNRFIRFGTPGCADIIGLTRRGRFMAIECKAGKGKLRDSQVAFQEHIESKNGIYIVARSIEDLEKRKSEIV